MNQGPDLDFLLFVWVGLLRALAHASWEVKRLLDMAGGWATAACHAVDTRADVTTDSDSNPSLLQTQSEQQPHSLSERLGEEAVQELIAQFRAGTSQRQLAEQYQTSVSSIKRLLRAHGVRLWAMEQHRAKVHRVEVDQSPAAVQSKLSALPLEAMEQR